MSQEALGVFVSYARKDARPVAPIIAALEAQNMQTRIDTADIAPGEDWRTRIGALLGEADVVLAMLSPAFLKSEICLWEAAEALRRGKRLVPVAIRPVQARALPEDIRPLNVVSLSGGSNRRRNLGAVVAAIRADTPWVREYALLSVSAARWLEQKKGAALLLGPATAEAASALLAARPSSVPPAATEVIDFVAASRERNQEETKRTARLAGRAFVDPSATACDQHRYDLALRLILSGAVAADDKACEIVPELLPPAFTALFNNAVFSLHRMYYPNRSYAMHAGGRCYAFTNSDAGVYVRSIAEPGRMQTVFWGEDFLGPAHLQFSPDGGHLLVSYGRATALVDVATGEKEFLPGLDAVLAAHFHENGLLLARQPDGGNLQIQDARAQDLPAVLLKGPDADGYCIGFDVDGACIALLDTEAHALKVFDTRSGAGVDAGAIPPAFNASWAPGGQELVILCEDRTEVVLWSVPGKQAVWRMACPEDTISAQLSADGRCLSVAGANSGVLRVRAPFGPVLSKTFLQMGQALVARWASDDGARFLAHHKDGQGGVACVSPIGTEDAPATPLFADVPLNLKAATTSLPTHSIEKTSSGIRIIDLSRPDAPVFDRNDFDDYFGASFLTPDFAFVYDTDHDKFDTALGIVRLSTGETAWGGGGRRAAFSYAAATEDEAFAVSFCNDMPGVPGYGRTQLWDLKRHRFVAQIGVRTGSISHFTTTASGAFVVLVWGELDWALFDVEGRHVVGWLAGEQAIAEVTISEDGAYLGLLLKSGEFELWRTNPKVRLWRSRIVRNEGPRMAAARFLVGEDRSAAAPTSLRIFMQMEEGPPFVLAAAGVARFAQPPVEAAWAQLYAGGGRVFGEEQGNILLKEFRGDIVNYAIERWGVDGLSDAALGAAFGPKVDKVALRERW